MMEDDQQIATPDMCVHCFNSIISYFPPESAKITTGPSDVSIFPREKYPMFVTWNSIQEDGSRTLRGCIGTFKPQPLAPGLWEYARLSAFKDSRFSPVRLDEISKLSCSVSLLMREENGKNVWDWIPGKHGIIINFQDSDGSLREATYLPEVAIEQNWNREQTIRSLIKKTMYRGEITDALLRQIKLRRYQASKTELTYQQYIDYKIERVNRATLTSYKKPDLLSL